VVVLESSQPYLGTMPSDFSQTDAPAIDDGGPMSSRAQAKAAAKAAAREEKQSARDKREAERQKVREEKRELKDLRWAVERHRINETEWRRLRDLQLLHGKEGWRQFTLELLPLWKQCQFSNHGSAPPADLFTELFPQANGKKLRALTTRPTPGAPRKQRRDAGIAHPSRKGARK
jgi:hypothetical protein